MYDFCAAVKKRVITFSFGVLRISASIREGTLCIQLFTNLCNLLTELSITQYKKMTIKYRRINKAYTT